MRLRTAPSISNPPRLNRSVASTSTPVSLRMGSDCKLLASLDCQREGRCPVGTPVRAGYFYAAGGHPQSTGRFTSVVRSRMPCVRSRAPFVWDDGREDRVLFPPPKGGVFEPNSRLTVSGHPIGPAVLGRVTSIDPPPSGTVFFPVTLSLPFACPPPTPCSPRSRPGRACSIPSCPVQPLMQHPHPFLDLSVRCSFGCFQDAPRPPDALAPVDVAVRPPAPVFFFLVSSLLAGTCLPALRLAWSRHPERFVNGTPKPQTLPQEVWIKPPAASATARPAQ